MATPAELPEGTRADVPVRTSLAHNGTAGHQLMGQAISDICRARLGTSKVHALRHTFAVEMETVGAKVSEIGARWPEERCDYGWRGGRHVLLLVLAHRSEDDIRTVIEGPCERAYLEHGDISPAILFCSHFGDALPWSANPYTWRALDSRDQRSGLPRWALDTPHARALLHVVLVRAETGIVEGLRLVTFSTAFTAALHLAIRRQAALPYDDAAYNAAVDELYVRYPTTEALLQVPGPVWCMGGNSP